MYSDYINGQIILLKFLKECISEFCKSDMEKLHLIYDIIMGKKDKEELLRFLISK